MVRETRHLWVGNLPENIREERIRDHFKRYGRVQSVKLLGRSAGGGKEEEGGGACATVSFMDIKSAAKAHHSEQKLDERTLTTEYHEPAAIPCPGTLYSGSGPPNPPGASAGSRFSSHGGSEDLSGSFERSSHFYERGERGETTGSAYIRRGGSSSGSGAYHSAEPLNRSRARDRLYRNGPYTPLIERVVSRSTPSGHHRVSSSGWGYDSPSPRYSASGVPSTPELPYTDDRRETTPVVHKKHSKSGFSTQNNSYPTLLISISRRSGSDSASNSGSSGSRSRSSSASSQSGSSTCSSASSSPTSEKSCSTHSQQSSLRSGAQSGVSASHTNSVSPAVHSEDRRPLAICVRNLPARSSDTSLKDGLYHEYKKHGKVTWVKVVGQGVDRYALVCFKKADDVEKALQVSHDKLFFGCKIEVAPYQGYDVDDNEFRPFEAEQDEFHPKATRTLFIGNLEKDITTQEIRKHFDQFGEIIEIDIKKQGNSASYAFCQFSDISSVVRAMRTLDGEHIGANRIKLGFGKSMHSNCVWVDGVSETVSEKYLSTHFGQFGPVTQVVIDRSRGHALVFYEQITYAQQAVKDMRGNSLRGRKLQVDYASRECQEALYDRIDKQSCTSHSSNFENSVQASPQSSSTIVRVYDNSPVATSPAINAAPTRYPTLTTGGSGVVVTTRFNTTNATSRAAYNRPSASSPTTPSPSPRSSRHGHSSATQRFDYNLDYNSDRRYRNYEDNQSCEDNGNLSQPMTGSNQPMTGSGEIRHLQKDRVTLVDQLEDCASSGDDTATGRRRCSKHRRSQSGGEGSRPGTPLCDERPDPPVEPRRLPRERPPDPLSLPLPRFAAQVLSPRPTLPSPPASPQTPHSSSSDSEPSPPSPEWEERLRSLDEKYEKWSGSRSGVTKVDPSTLKIKHKLLELDLHELQPSEIVKSVLAKRSVFDEDSKRLENFGEKYEPREFIPASRTNVLRRLDMSPLPPSPVNKSPGLQYPFPSHPPSAQSIGTGGSLANSANSSQTVVIPSEGKPTNTFLTNCTRQFTPKNSSPSSDTVPRPSNMQHADKFKTKCTPTPIPTAAPSSKKDHAIVTTPPPPPPSPKPKPISIRRDSSEEKSELRRKSREELCTEIAAKKDDISESDKIKDAQISERRKSSVDKRRSSVDIKEFSNSKPSCNSCDRPKDVADKQEEKRRGSTDVESTGINDPRLKPDTKKSHESIDDNTRIVDDKRRLNDSVERRKEVESLHRHNSTENQDKKKDVLGVNSEKDRRRGRESFDNSDNPKPIRKVPDIKKEIESANEKSKNDDLDRKKEPSENQSKSKEKRDSVDKEKRRDSKEESDKTKMDRVNENDRFNKEYKKSEVDNFKKKEHENGDKAKKDEEPPKNSRREDHEESKKHYKEDRRKNSENEISKEHSLFKKVFGFADSIRHHKAGNVDRRDNDTSTAVKTDTPEPSNNKHRDKKEKKEREDQHSESKHKFNRKSPDGLEISRHNNKEERRRHSESKRKDGDIDDLKIKEDNHLPLESKHKSDRKKEDSSYKDSNHRNAFYEHSASEHTKYTRDTDRRKDSFQDDSKKVENDSNCVENNKHKDDHEDYFEKRKDDKRKSSIDGINDSIGDKKNDQDGPKYSKHDRHKDKSKDSEVVNCRNKEEKKNESHDVRHRNERKGEHRIKEEKKINDEAIFDLLKKEECKKEDYDGLKKEDYTLFRDSIRKKDVTQDRLKEITERKKEEKERRREREMIIKESGDDKRRENDKSKSKNRDYDSIEPPKMNGDHDGDYSVDIDCHKTIMTYENDHRESGKKEKKRDKNSWPATIGCKRRLSSQDSVDNSDESKRPKPERRDSKDSGRSSSSSRKGSGDKHKGYKLLEEKIKEDREREQRKSDENNHENNPGEDKTPKPAIRKEKRNSGEKRKEERKFKVRARENGTASESDMASGDDDQLNKSSTKRQQHSIFDIVDDEPAYISMYDKVKARSTKNMQKLEEEKRQEKLKEKFHALKQSRAKREEKKRSTSYDEDSDSEKSSIRRSAKLLLTSSEDDGGSELDMKARKNKILYDTSEDDVAVSSGGKSRKTLGLNDNNKSSRKIVSDISEDDSTIKHSTPKTKVNRSITFDTEPKSRKIMSDTSEDDSSRINSTPRTMKPGRINSDESEGDLGFEDSIKNESKPLQNINDMFHSRPVEINHFANSIREDGNQHPLQSSPESFRRNSLDSTASEQHRKKSHKKKQKRSKNLEENEDGSIKKHSSKKDKKRAHRDKDDEEKRKKRSERENINKREDKMEDIFGPLSDDSVKAIGNKWNVAQVYGSDSESERENIRKKEKKRREKKLRELDEAGRAIEAKLLDSCDNLNLDEPVKTKKKKRKKSRDEKSKHHQIREMDDSSVAVAVAVVTKLDSINVPAEEKHMPVLEIKEEAPDVNEDIDNKDEYSLEVKSETKLECDEELDISQNLRQQSMASLLDSPPPSQPSSISSKKPGIPGFSSEMDENIHETAVKSISESNCTTLEDSSLKYDDKSKTEDTPVTNEEGKPTTISQEETEDAVAALLMEDAFGGGFEAYNEDTPKPDTPVSEPDLQIDTDTEDTYDPIDFSRPPRTPDIPSNFYRQNDTREGLEERIMSLACSSDSSLKESPRPLQMPPTPDHKPDKKDNSDSDSFEPEKSLAKEKLPVVKQLAELSEKEPSPILSDKKGPTEPVIVDKRKPEKEPLISSMTSPRGSSSEPPKQIPLPPSEKQQPPEPVERLIPPPTLDMPKLIVIPQKVPTISVTLQQDVPSLAPLSNKIEATPNFPKSENKPFVPSLVRSVPAPIPQFCAPVSCASQISKMELPVISTPMSRGLSSSSCKTITNNTPKSFDSQVWSSKTAIISEVIEIPDDTKPPQVSHSTPHLPTKPSAAVSASKEITSTLPSSTKVLHEVLSPTPKPAQSVLALQPMVAQTVSLSQPPPLIQTVLSKPPPLVHSSSVNIVSSASIVSRSEVITSQNQNTLSLPTTTSVPNINIPVQFTSQPTHHLPINSLPPLKPVLNVHISPTSPLGHIKSTLVTPSLTCPSPIVSAPVRTIHPRASASLVPAIKDVKSTVLPSSTLPTSTLQAKQLHVITHAPQLSPTPSISPHNVKLIRPSLAVTTHVQVPPLQSINIQSLKTPVISQLSPNRPIPTAPLLQAINIDDIKSSPNFICKTLPPLTTNPQLLLTPIQAPHPEKVITLTPSQPFHPAQHSPVLHSPKPPVPVNVIKTSEPSTNEPPQELLKKIKEEVIDDPDPVIIIPDDPPIIPNIIKPTTVELPSNKPILKQNEIVLPKTNVEVAVEPVIQNQVEIKEEMVTNDEKPLNAVIQDLALRAANKQQPVWKPKTNLVESNKPDTCKPIEQVVRELAMKKKQANEGKVIDHTEMPHPIESIKVEVITPDESESLPSEEPILSETIKPKENTFLKQLPPKKQNSIQELPAKDEIPAKVVEDAPKPAEIGHEPEVEKPCLEGGEKLDNGKTPAVIVEPPKIEEQKTQDNKSDTFDEKGQKSVALKEARQPVEKEAFKPDFVGSTPSVRGGRGSRKRKGAGGRGAVSTRRTRANNSTTTTPSTDIYEFRDDSEEETGRPRLILTIKSPPEPTAVPKVLIPAPQPSPQSAPPSPPPTPVIATSIAPTASPASGAKTRKSRRLQEKDGTKSSADEVIDEMVVTRGRPSRRATRSTVQTLAPPVETTRKSPRRKQNQSSTSNLQIPVHNTRQRSASPHPATSPTPPQMNKSPTPQRNASPIKPSNPTHPVIAPSTVTPLLSSPKASTLHPVPQPEPINLPQPPPPPAGSPVSVVVSTPCSIGQPTPPPTPSTPNSQASLVASSPPVTITTAHAVPTTPAPAHSARNPVMTSHVLTSPVQLTTSSHHPPTTISVQPLASQPPPAHSGPAHSMSVQSIHQVTSHHSTSYLGPQASAIKFRCKTSPGEPTKLIDPVTGLLIPMAESEEGQYVPIGDVHRTAGGNVAARLNKEPSEGEPPEKRTRLLNLVGKEEAIARIPLSRPSVVRPPASQSSTPSTVTPPAAHSQSVKILVPTNHPIEAHLGRGPQIPPSLIGSGPPKAPLSGIVPMTPKSHLVQAITPNRTRPQILPSNQLTKGPMAPKAHILQSVGNAQSREGVIGSPAPHQGSLLTGSVASPPLRAHQQPIVTGASSGRILMKSISDLQNSRVGEAKQHIVGPSPSSQVQQPQSQVVQPGMPLSAYEASLHSVVAELLPNPPWSQRHTPPPAHQNSTQQQGEVVQHVATYPPHHHYVHPPFVFQSPYLRDNAGLPGPYHRSGASKGAIVKGSEIDDRPAAPSGPTSSAIVASPPLELRRRSPHDRTTDSPQVVPVYMHRTGQQFYYEGPHHPPPPAHRPHNPPNTGRLQTPPHASQVPPQADSLLMLLQRYPVMWQGLLALKNDQAAVQMHFVFGNPVVARESLPCNSDGSTPPLRIAQRMRLEQTQIEGVSRKMQMDNEHCMLLALPCGRDHLDVLQQSNNLQNGFITYLQRKQAAGIVNIAAPGSPQPGYVVHIFPACDFANESLARIAPDLLHRVANLAHLLIVIATV